MTVSSSKRPVPLLDSATFEGLVRRNYRNIFAYAFSLTGKRSGVEDIVQEAFLTAYRKRETFDPKRDFAAWVRGIIRLKYLEWARSRKKEALTHERLLQIEIRFLDWTSATDHHADLLRKLKRCMETLSNRIREIIALFYRTEKTCKTIAQETGQTEEGVKKRLQRARTLLEKCIKSRPGGIS